MVSVNVVATGFTVTGGEAAIVHVTRATGSLAIVPVQADIAVYK